jgi:hypothetical protein
MRTLTLLPVTAALTMLSGCAGWVVFGHTIQGDRSAAAAAPSSAAPAPSPEPPPSSAAPTPPAAAAAPAAPLLRAVTVTFSPAAQQKLAGEPQFNQATLLTTIEAELRAHKLLDAADPRASASLHISIDDFENKPTSNAVVFGYILGTGTLAGNMEVRAAAGKDTKDTRVSAESRLTRSVSGGEANPFAPLYHRFAAATVTSLTGTPAQLDEPHWGQDRTP